MGEIRVSVIVPCYNSASTVADTLNSLRNQTFRDWEAIVVNDGSTDQSLDIINAFAAKDPRIRCIQQENQGLAAARNAGIQAAKGEFLNFMDADDLLLPAMLQKTVEALRNQPEAGVVSCNWIVTDSQLKDRSWVNKPETDLKMFFQLAMENVFQVNSLLMRRSVLEDIGLFDVSLKHCHDWDMWQRIARKGILFGRVPEVLAVYRMISQSLSRKVETFYEAGLQVVQRAFAPDPRVICPDPKFAQGCKPAQFEEAWLNWALHCCAMAIAQGNVDWAFRLMEKALKKNPASITASLLCKRMEFGLWFGSDIVRGQWDALIPKISSSLLQFLARMETLLQKPGFALEFIRLFLNKSPEVLYGRKLITLLLERIKSKYVLRRLRLWVYQLGETSRGVRYEQDFLPAKKTSSELTPPKVSVIIPCFNSELTIRDTLNSLLLQTFHDWETIVVNDGSTDSSPKIVQEFMARDTRIKLITQENKGLAGARNAGIAVAKGEFIDFLDSDDLLLPGMFSKTLKRFSEDPSLGAVHCGVIVADADLTQLHWRGGSFLEGELFHLFRSSNPFPPHAFLIRRAVVNDVGLFDASVAPCEDWDYWMRIARKGVQFGCIDKPLVIYRMRSTSMIRNTLSFYEAGVKIIERAYAPDDLFQNANTQSEKGFDSNDEKKKSCFDWALSGCAIAIAKGDADQADRILDLAFKNYPVSADPDYFADVMGGFFWFGSALPMGNWNLLLPRLSLPLISFLERIEARLHMPGFAMEFLKRFLDTRKHEYYGQELVRLLWKRVKEKMLPNKVKTN